MKRINWKIVILAALALIMSIAGLRINAWKEGTLGPSQAALTALLPDDTVNVKLSAGLVIFEPTQSTPDTGFILYPGAHVDFQSYAPAMRKIAQAGFLTAIPAMPLNIAFFNPGAAGRIMLSHPEISHWIIGGHSLGGVVAADYILKHADIDGLVFWASYPRDDSLVSSNVKVLSISATLDGVSTPKKIERMQARLPSGAQTAVIEGGNHAQFGSYGSQRGDKAALISPEEQTTQLVEITVNFLKEISRLP